MNGNLTPTLRPNFLDYMVINNNKRDPKYCASIHFASLRAAKKQKNKKEGHKATRLELSFKPSRRKRVKCNAMLSLNLLLLIQQINNLEPSALNYPLRQVFKSFFEILDKNKT